MPDIRDAHSLTGHCTAPLSAPLTAQHHSLHSTAHCTAPLRSLHSTAHCTAAPLTAQHRSVLGTAYHQSRAQPELIVSFVMLSFLTAFVIFSRAFLSSLIFILLLSFPSHRFRFVTLCFGFSLFSLWFRLRRFRSEGGWPSFSGQAPSARVSFVQMPS